MSEESSADRATSDRVESDATFHIAPSDQADNNNTQPDYEMNATDDRFDSSTTGLDDCNDDSDTEQSTSVVPSVIKFMLQYFVIWIAKYNISDRAAESLLKFFCSIASWLGGKFGIFNRVLKFIPRTMYSVYKQLGLFDRTDHVFVVCPKCYNLHEQSECLRDASCSAVRFPAHPQKSRRSKCNESLGKVVFNNNERKFHPRMKLCVQSISQKLKSFCARAGFIQRCNEWKERDTFEQTGYYRDIYDGRIWRDFQSVDDIPFLSGPCNIGLMLNIDWFQPYSHCQYSVGAVYLSLMNLPRHLRFKTENIILVAVLPGPNEPDAEGLCHLMRPIVDELLKLWTDGVEVTVGKQLLTVKAALLCVAADLPAARKLCGFLGHGAKLGCSKCTKEFKTQKFGDKTDYSGFDREQPRHPEQHRRDVLESAQKTSESSQKKFNKEHGARYTELIRLPYVNLVRMTVIDPMHNLFLGTAKHVFKDIWGEKHELHDKEKLCDIERIVECVHAPSEIGRMPHKIAHNFQSFTADQWKNWCMYYSLLCMKAHLPSGTYDAWKCFVEACRLLCKPVIHKEEVRKSHENLLKFCRSIENIYGAHVITPNMHLHQHLMDCIFDFGPIYSFWLFPFERFNGVLGSFNRNNLHIEEQIMVRFERSHRVKALQVPEMFRDNYDESDVWSVGSLASTVAKSFSPSQVAEYKEILLSKLPSHHLLSRSSITVLGTGQTDVVGDVHLNFLKQCLSFINPEFKEAEVSGGFKKHSVVHHMGQVYHGSKSRAPHVDSNILASWYGRDGQIDMTQRLVPGTILYFMNFFVTVPNSTKRNEITLAYVEWYQPHAARDSFGSESVTIWTNPELCSEPDGPASFLPLQRISSKFIRGNIKLRNESVAAVIPLNDKICW